MSDGGWWALLNTGISFIDAVHADEAAKAPVRESDDSLRARLLYVAADGERAAHRILNASGAELDALAEACCLRRRAL